MASLSQNKKAIEARRWRVTTALKKRFDGPLREFIRLKHTEIYNEYNEFYIHLDKENPSVRDLTKTKMFKEWVKTRQQHQSPESPTEFPPVQTESQNDISLRSIVQETLPEVPPVQTESQNDISLRSIVQETLPEGIPEEVSVSLNEILPPVNQQNGVNLQDLINELEQDEAIRNILDPVVDDMFERYNAQLTTNDDEGIELNIMDEIDVQPLDFELEVNF